MKKIITAAINLFALLELLYLYNIQFAIIDRYKGYSCSIMKFS